MSENVELKSLRFCRCACQPHAEKTFSPLQALLPQHLSQELLYMEVKWSFLPPYEVSCDLLHDVLPVDEKLSAVTIRNHFFQVAERLEGKLRLHPEQSRVHPELWRAVPEQGAILDRICGIDGEPCGE